MRGINVIRLSFAAVLIIILALAVFRYSEAAMYAYEVCTLRTYTIECDDGYNTFTTTLSYWDCVTYYLYLYDGSGGGSGGGGDNVGIDDPGGGGGAVIVNPKFDSNNDNILDCYKSLMFLRENYLVITSGFRTEERPDHDGLDIGSYPDRAACYGQPVYSVCNGTVKKVYYSVSGGWTVILIDNNGREWGICHLIADPSQDSSINLYEGRRVYAGITAIGRADSTGRSCDGPHIHLSLKINGEYEDPTKFLSKC